MAALITSDAKKGMFKVIALIVGAIFLMTLGVYFLANADLQEFVFPFFQLPALDVNWQVVGFVTIVGSIAAFGSAFVASRLNK